MSEKPIEFWLINYDGMNPRFEVRTSEPPLGPIYIVDKIHVIEYAAFEQLKAQLDTANLKLEHTETQYQRAMNTMRTQLAEKDKQISDLEQLMSVQLDMVSQLDEANKRIEELEKKLEGIAGFLEKRNFALVRAQERIEELERYNATHHSAKYVQGLIDFKDRFEKLAEEATARAEKYKNIVKAGIAALEVAQEPGAAKILREALADSEGE